MKTDRATLILASLLSSPRRFRSYELSKAAKQRLATVQHLLEGFDKLTFASNYAEALSQLNQAYRELEAEPPPGTADDLTSRKHPVLFAFDNPNPGAETDAWRAFVSELRTP